MRFLLAGEAHESGRLLVFLSDSFPTFLCSALVVACDGTFQSVPSIFHQPFTVNFFYNGKLVPACFVLCSSKSQSVYQRIFTILTDYASSKNLVFSPQLSVILKSQSFLVLEHSYRIHMYTVAFFIFVSPFSGGYRN